MLRAIGLAVYLGIGLVVANSEHYLDRLGSLEGVVSAVLALVLWPVVLVGVDLHIGGLDVDIRRR